MIIQHNMQAQNSIRIYGKNTRSHSRISKCLASGLRINQAADDAAGLSISEKFRTQVRGLSHAQGNIQDGISLLQTADGALGEISGIMQRMRELCVQGANDTYVDADRDSIQREIGNLAECIDDIIDGTEFNTKKILKLGDAYVRYVETVVGQLPASVAVSGNLQTGVFPPLTSQTGANYAFAAIDFSALQTAADVKTLIDNGFYTTCCTCDNKYNIRFIDRTSAPSQNVGKNPVFDVNIDGLTNGAQVVDAIVKSVTTNHYTEFMVDPANRSQLYIYDYRRGQTPYPAQNRGVVVAELIRTDAFIDDPGNFNIQAGPNKEQFVALELPTLSAARLGVSTLSVKSNLAANTSLDRVDVALDTLNLERSRLGAKQNRLEHAYDYASNAEENQQAAESRIRDTDMAEGMMQYAKYNILLQVSESMTAQANQKPQSVLSLIH